MNALENSFTESVPSDVVISYIRLYKKVGQGDADIKALNPEYGVYHPLVFKDDITYLYRTYFKDSKLSDTRLNSFIQKEGEQKPKNSDEAIALNIVKAFSLIYSSKNFELTVNEIQMLAVLLYENTSATDNQFKRQEKGMVKNYRECLDDLSKLYNLLKQEGKVEIGYLNASFLVDFLKLAPFEKGNELIGIIIYYVLTLASDIKAFAYVSFFKHLSEASNSYEEALKKAFYLYDEKMQNVTPLLRVFLKIDELAYDELAVLRKNMEFDKDLSKAKAVVAVIYKLNETFAKEDIRKAMPQVSVSTIDRVLKSLKESGKIAAFGRGRKAKWVRLDDSQSDKMRFIDDFKV